MTIEMYTIPSQEVLELRAAETPPRYVPNEMPLAFVGEAFLSDAECDALCELFDAIPSHRYRGCGAITTEFPTGEKSLSLETIESFALMANVAHFGFDLNEGYDAWHQHYEAGGEYQLHTDNEIGRSRKLTAVAFLSKPEAFEGGGLRLYGIPRYYDIPKVRGTVVVFPGWVPHEVYPVTAGERRTINMGFHGPTFR